MDRDKGVLLKETIVKLISSASNVHFLTFFLLLPSLAEKERRERP